VNDFSFAATTSKASPQLIEACATGQHIKTALTAGQQPGVSALARRQAQECGAVSTLRHTTLRIDDPEGRRLLTLLDGTRDRATLVRLLAGGGEPPPGLAAKLDRKLDELGRLALLEA
jgi:hypothetical protein